MSTRNSDLGFARVYGYRECGAVDGYGVGGTEAAVGDGCDGLNRFGILRDACVDEDCWDEHPRILCHHKYRLRMDKA